MESDVRDGSGVEVEQTPKPTLSHHEWLQTRREAEWRSSRRSIRHNPRTFCVGDVVATASNSGFFGDLPVFKCRTVFVEQSVHGEVIALAKFVEWKLVDTFFASWEDFIAAADDRTASDFECAEMLRRHWSWEEWPFDYGNVVIFEHFIVSRTHPDLWASMRETIQRLFGRKGSVLVLKAFPLEWQGQGKTQDGSLFEKRLAAMKRHYAKQLGVAPIGRGDRDWMWRPLRHCPAPQDQAMTF